MRLDVYVHFIEQPGVTAQLDTILYLLKGLKAQGRNIMSAADDIKILVTDLNAATNEVAARIQVLTDQLAAGGTPQELADIKAALAAEIARLKALGQDPNNPVPVVPPALAAMRAKRP